MLLKRRIQLPVTPTSVLPFSRDYQLPGALLYLLPVALTFLLLAGNAKAQFWHAVSPLDLHKSAIANFSQDEKKVYYLSAEGGIANVWSIPTKGGAPVQVTKFTDHGVVRSYHLLNRPEVVFMRATDQAGKDFHLYKVKDDGTGEILDLTPSVTGVSNEIIGVSYNGRYVYYTSNKVDRSKTDTYRYDTQQNISELILPNDKDYKVIAWSRDQTRLLMEDPANGELLLFDIASTERKALTKPAAGTYLHAIMDPTNHELLVVEKSQSSESTRMLDLGTNAWKEAKELNASVWKEVAEGDVNWIDYSPNGKYLIVKNNTKWTVRELPVGTELTLPSGAQPVSIAPRETMLVYATPVDATHSKLALYDIQKKTSTDLVTVTIP